MFLNHTQRRSTVGRTPLDEWSARRRDLYLTTHNTHNRKKSMPPVGFEPKISAGERPQTYALDRAVNGTGIISQMQSENHCSCISFLPFLIYRCPSWPHGRRKKLINFLLVSTIMWEGRQYFRLITFLYDAYSKTKGSNRWYCQLLVADEWSTDGTMLTGKNWSRRRKTSPITTSWNTNHT